MIELRTSLQNFKFELKLCVLIFDIVIYKIILFITNKRGFIMNGNFNAIYT